jgi:hypothetical protein
MVESKAIAQDPKIVAVLGPYELLPGSKAPALMTEVWLGAEGAIWPDCPGDPILWREVKTLDVLMLDLGDGVTAHVVEAMVAREQLLADHLLQYFVDRGVSKESWPVVDLSGKAPKRPTPEKEQETAARRLHDFEAVCTHGDDPALGRYVEFDRDSGSLTLQAILSLGVVGGALYILQMGLPLKHGNLSPDNPIGVALAGALAIAGLWWLVRVLWMWVRPCRLRVGENGFAVMPKGPAIIWSDIASFELRAASPGRRLQVLANPRENVQSGRLKGQSRSWWLPPLQAPSTLPAVEYLMKVQLEAFNSRRLVGAVHQPQDAQSELQRVR